MGNGEGKNAPSLKYVAQTMMKLGIVIPYLKKIQLVYKLPDAPLDSADITIFSLEISNFCYIKKCRYRLQYLIILTFSLDFTGCFSAIKKKTG